MHQWHDATVDSFTATAAGLHHLVVSVRPEATASYVTAGQYTRLLVQGQPVGAYAFASAPGSKSSLEFLVKDDSLFFNALSAPKGYPALKLSEAIGPGFPLARASGRPLWLLGTGSGLAPLRAVVQAVLNSPQRPSAVSLLYGARTESHVPFAGEFSQWQQQGVEVRVTLSQAPREWTGLCGYVQAHLAGVGHGDGLVFLCGQVQMMEETSALLEEAGVGKARIFLNI